MSLRDYNRFVSAVFSGKSIYDYKDKDSCVATYNMYMLNKTQSMFAWSGLPDTIPQRDLELMLQCRGFAGVCEIPDKGIYALCGGLGGEPNPYYMPTMLTVSNPSLKYSANLVIDEDVIIIPNDSMYLGLIPLFTRYSKQMVETDLSMNIALINARIVSLISADNDNAKESAEAYIDKIVKGELGVIANGAFLEGVKAQPFSTTSNSNTLTNLIEILQYLKASWYNEIGLNANYNMKRESINSHESQLNNDALLPLIDDMLANRRRAVEKINDKYGLSISVDFASSWEDNEIELESEQEIIAQDEQESTSDDLGGENDEG